MDEMKIKSKFLTGIISRLLRRTLTKKLGSDVDLRVNEIGFTCDEGRVHVHLDLDCDAEKEVLAKILKCAD